MKKSIFLIFTTLVIYTTSFGQRALSEQVSYFDVRIPNNQLDESIKTYNTIVETPYTLTVAELNAQSLADFEVEKANYVNVLKESEIEFQERLTNHDDEVIKAEARYDKEMKDFKDLTLLERLALTDQGKKPKLRVPSKPTYVKPREPQYIQPNLNDHLIFDNNVLADGVVLLGYEKGSDILFIINISKMIFQDNGGQTFYSQSTNLKVMKGADLINEKNFDDEFQFLTSSSSNTINLERYEKNNVNKIMKNIGKYINEEFGYIPVASSIKIEFPKNKNRAYDALENAKIKAISAYRKLKKETSSEIRERSKTELEAVRDVWKTELAKVDYNDKKAVMNKKIAKMIFFNLMRVDISLKDKTQAEETLGLMQERRIDLDLDYNDKITFTRLEEQVYKL
ncbi:hypothetical protein A9Q86_15845 [Flavobacteriales bacterium 33_180_T64]|nr:hypothetical protein A9Q86_15845 [Flavobacteriales bacterium 33_180_T64]